MGVSALRYAACAGVLIGALVLGHGAAGIALADPNGTEPGHSEEQTSKAVNNERAGLAHLLQRILGEHRKRLRHETHTAPRVKFGSEPENLTTGSVTTLVETDTAPAPDVAPTDERTTDPQPTSSEGTDVSQGTDIGGGTDAGDGSSAQPVAASDTGGSDYSDNAAVAAEPETPKPPAVIFSYPYPYPYYLWELQRRDGGNWWNVDQLVSSLQQVISPLLPTPPTPQPEPEPDQVIGPAFRGGAPEPEPVLDASGGVTGGGGGYAATTFAGAPVLSAPIVAMPAPPPAAARFPAFPAVAEPATPSVGSTMARVAAGVEPQAQGRATGSPQASSETVKAMSGEAGQPPRQLGYTDYLRSPGLPQLAGAALPGVAGILLMTLAGGVLGYRQASAGRMIRSSAAARYLP
jgi:hypothetical protein